MKSAELIYQTLKKEGEEYGVILTDSIGSLLRHIYWDRCIKLPLPASRPTHPAWAGIQPSIQGFGWCQLVAITTVTVV